MARDPGGRPRTLERVICVTRPSRYAGGQAATLSRQARCRRKNAALPTLQWRAAKVNGLAGFVMREQDGALDTRLSSSCDRSEPAPLTGSLVPTWKGFDTLDLKEPKVKIALGE